MTDSFDALLQSEIKELISELEKAAKRGEYYYDIPDTFKFKQSLSNGKIRDYFINYFQTEYGVNIHIGCGEEFMIDWVN